MTEGEGPAGPIHLRRASWSAALRRTVDEFLDWKPGRYLTRRYRGTPMGECVFTWEIEAEPTELPRRTTLRVLGTAPTRLGRIRMRVLGMPFRRFLVRSTEQLAVELAKASASADPLRPSGGTISRSR